MADLENGSQPEGKMGNYSVCCCFTRKFKMTKVDPPSDVKKAFEKFSGGEIHMNDDQLRRFIEECQGGDGGAVSFSGDESIVEQIHHKKHHFTSIINRKTLTLEDFHYYLFNSELNPPIKYQVHQKDMNFPLSHYFIYTGHNSYLTGNQLSSRSSDTPIIKALKRGVRVIELDLWPCKDNVKVVHGRTLTKPVKLLKCLKSIKEHAFTASPYPVIITLEDHLTRDLQEKVAQMVKDTFGEMLFCPRSAKPNELLTPECLKKRILISTKPPNEYKEEEDRRTKSQRAKDSAQDDIWGEEPSSAIAYEDKSDNFESDHNRNIEDCDVKNFDSSQSLAYKDLIAIHSGKPKGGLVEALKVEKDKVRRLSLSEQTLEKASRHHQQQLVRFTQKNILRIYPKGTRFTSSNYKPLVGWLHGAQMVAFNMQGYGRSLWLMHGMFRANGGCGYVKKPDFLMKSGPNNKVFDPSAELPIKTTLKVKVYMGDGWHHDFKRTHFDKCSPPDFYTKIGISGAPADEIMEKTEMKKDTWSPVWNKEFEFPLRLPEIALLRIEVHEYDVSEKDDFGGQTCLPVSELRPGIRAVPLCSRKGDTYTGARLLMRFEFVLNES